MRWPIIVFRTALTWTVGALATVAGAIGVVVLGAVRPNSPAVESVIRWWSRMWLIASGTKVTIEGEHQVQADQSYVVVANHLSTLDIMVCFLAVEVPIRYLAKKELFRVPVLAQAMRAIGIIEVDRTGRTAIHNSVNRQAQGLIANNRSLIIFPEGTRPRDGVMKPFKKGAFTMAIQSGLPVLPLSIHGTYEAAAPGKPWFYGGEVTAIIDSPIETKHLNPKDADSLRDHVRELIAKRVTDLGAD